MNNTRKDIRSDIIKRRRALSAEQITQASAQACQHIINTELWQRSQRIAFYMAQVGEADPQSLMQHAFAQNKTCYLPALASNDLKHLVMVRYQLGDQLPENLYGIPEPIQDINAIISPAELDLAIVPLVAFDNTGTRFGMGVGYYDRTFAFLNQPSRPHHPQLIGLAHSFQQQLTLQREDWDVPLDMIATEKELILATPT